MSARGLRKSYGALEVVCGVDLAVAPGECFGLLGPNGAGKTTTLRLCLGLIEPDAGEIELLGEPVPRRAREARARVGVVPQFDNLDPDFTVAENLLVYGRYFGLSPREVRARIPPLLEFAGLTGRGDAKINTLSGGMKRRLTLARALVNDPQLMFLDEPTTGLDPQARHLIWERLRRLTQEGKTMVLTTHFMEEAERLCHRLAIMDHGRIIAAGLAARADRRAHRAAGGGGARRRAYEAWMERAKALAPRVERVGRYRVLLRARTSRRSCKSSGRPERAGLPAPARQPRGRVPQAHRARSRGTEPVRWIAVWRRNFLVWRKLLAASVLTNLADPLIMLFGLGYGLGALLPAVEGMSYIAFFAAGQLCTATMYTASFESMFSGFSRMHGQKTWDAILYAPLVIDDIVAGEIVWAASKAWLTGSTILGVVLVFGWRLAAGAARAAGGVPRRPGVLGGRPHHDACSRAAGTSSATT